MHYHFIEDDRGDVTDLVPVNGDGKPSWQPAKKKPFTVLLYHPVWTDANSVSDWIVRVPVEIAQPFLIGSEIDEAIHTACIAAAKEHAREPDEFSVVAVYEGHIFDLFTP